MEKDGNQLFTHLSLYLPFTFTLTAIRLYINKRFFNNNLTTFYLFSLKNNVNKKNARRNICNFKLNIIAKLILIK